MTGRCGTTAMSFVVASGSGARSPRRPARPRDIPRSREGSRGVRSPAPRDSRPKNWFRVCSSDGGARLASSGPAPQKGAVMWKATAVLATAISLGLGPAVASAQELGQGGAGRIEIAAAPAGGFLVMKSDNGVEPKFTNFALTGSFTFNANKWIGFEGDVGFAMGVKQNLTFGAGVFNDQKTPNLLSFAGNVVVHPAGSDRAFVPYGAAGIGGLTMFNTPDVEALGVVKNETYLMTNAGGGVKWFAARHWGLRGDYRLLMIKNKDTAPEFFGRQELRLAHRVYGGLVLTY
jgi:hypothetical protein